MPTIKGAYTALITPFDHNDQLDEDGLRLLIQRQIENGIDGIVALGTTGEAPTVSTKEIRRIMTIAREEIKTGTKLVIGTGSYSTAKTIENTHQAELLGADAVLVVTPYYNKPTQEGLYRHFKAISDATQLPIILYNVQGRTGQNLQTETLKRLMDIPSIIGVKEASGCIPQINDVIDLAKKMRPDFSIVSGDDALTLPIMALGGHGVISVASNLLPKEIKTFVDTTYAGDYHMAREMHYELLPLFKALFIETNPIPIKAAMNFCRLPSGECRLPLCAMMPENAEKLSQVLHHYYNLASPTFR